MSNYKVKFSLRNRDETVLELQLNNEQFMQIIADQFKVEKFTHCTMEIKGSANDVLIKMDADELIGTRISLI